MSIETKVYKGKTLTIPKELRKKFDTEKNNIVIWDIKENGELILNFRKKREWEDIINIVEFEKDSTDLLKEIYEKEY